QGGGLVEPAACEVVGRDTLHRAALERGSGNLWIDHYTVQLHGQLEALFRHGPAEFNTARNDSARAAIHLDLGDVSRADFLAGGIVEQQEGLDLWLRRLDRAAVHDDHLADRLPLR